MVFQHIKVSLDRDVHLRIGVAFAGVFGQKILVGIFMK